MLVEFSVANYRCFRDRVTLSLEAEPRVSEGSEAVDERNVVHTPEGDLLRVVGIYGANASGKSNLLRALSALRSMVLDSAREGQAGDRLPVDPFRLEAESRRAPTELEVVFVLARVQYRYGIAVTSDRVEREWLFARLIGEDEQRWFERGREDYSVGPEWQRDISLEHKTRTEALHLSVAAAFNHLQSTTLLEWFRRLRVIDNRIDPLTRDLRHTTKLLAAERHGNAIRALIRRLDFGIDDLQVEGDTSVLDGTLQDMLVRLMKGQAMPRVIVIRSGARFELSDDESEGTKTAFDLADPIVEALASGDVVVIDELDAHLHTLLAKQIVELFQDPTTNPHGAQLVFASHDTNLLTRTLLRRDQLWFVEKSRKTHASDLYSLAELRLDDADSARYEADYLQGRYGAIPFFGNLHAILGEALKKQGE